MTTLAELQHELAERGLSARIWTTDRYLVWLFADDDPELGVFVGEGESLELAFKRALAAWDGAAPNLVTPN